MTRALGLMAKRGIVFRPRLETHDAVMLIVAGVVFGVWAILVMPYEYLGIGVAFGSVLLLLSWIDARTLTLPDQLTFGLGIGGLCATLVLWPERLSAHVVGAACGYVLLVLSALAARHLLRRDALGLGDAKLLGAIGCWVGWDALGSVLLIASLGGLVYAAVTRARKSAATRWQLIPFGPFLAIGGWIAFAHGPITFK